MHICYLHKRHKRLFRYIFAYFLHIKKVLTSLIKINCKVQDLSGDTSISKLLIEAERERMEGDVEWNRNQNRCLTVEMENNYVIHQEKNHLKRKSNLIINGKIFVLMVLTVGNSDLFPKTLGGTKTSVITQL